jgi:hypothetical protein
MSIFSRRKKQDELMLVFDIGSSSVKAALFYTRNSGVPKIITSVREPILLEDKVDLDRFLVLTIKALETVSEKIFTKGLGAPVKIFCIFSSPWHTSHTRVISLKQETPFVFTTKLADTLVQKEVSSLKQEYLKKYDHTDETLRVIEMKNIKVMLNGYETLNPVSKKAKELEMTVFISMSEELVCKKIEETISKHFQVGNIKFSSFTMASFTVIRDLFTDRGNFLLINIGGEITDISMVKHNTLRESTSFPLGINFMIRAVSAEMKCSLAEAKSLISLFKDGHASPNTTKSLELIIAKLKSDWLVNFQQSLANLSNDISIPAFVYTTVDKDLADFFTEIIKTEQFNQYTLTESKFQIVFLNIENLHGIADFEKENIWNAFLTIDAVYINRFLNGKI